MEITRVWAMPNKETFKIKPMKELLSQYVDDGKGWIDPFAGNNSPAEHTNDLNPDMKTKNHMTAREFTTSLTEKYRGVLFDPPYSLRQIKECYNGIGKNLSFNDTKDASFGKIKDIISPKIISNGYAISCGWNSNGFGKQRSFEIIEILLIPHGGHHNDTIVTVEKKQGVLNEKEALSQKERRLF